MRVLVIEDEASAAALVSEELRAVASDGVGSATSLEEAFGALDAHDYDCVVLDLSLPDGWGLDTLLTFRRRHPQLPVVVVSGTQDEAFEGKATRAGASGFLVKGAIERGDVAEAVLQAVAAARSGAVPTDAISELGHVGRTRSPVSARLFGQEDLREALTERFDDLAAQYSDLLELALERTAFQGDFGVADHLRELASSLGAVGAGPRDVAQLHARALAIQQERRSGPGTTEFVNESRLVVLELMGYLVSHYRAQALGADRSSTGGI